MITLKLHNVAKGKKGRHLKSLQSAWGPRVHAVRLMSPTRRRSGYVYVEPKVDALCEMLLGLPRQDMEDYAEAFMRVTARHAAYAL